MNKNLILFLFVVVYFGCMQPENSDVKKAVNLKGDFLPVHTNLSTHSDINGDMTTYEHELSMYNETYMMRITPTIDSVNHNYESNILLVKKSDTIFHKTITIDSLGQMILKHKIFEDSSEHAQIATAYQLRKVTYHGVRTNDLFFEADISSEIRQKNLTVLFQISYLHKDEIGKLFVNGFSEKGLGSNTVEK